MVLSFIWKKMNMDYNSYMEDWINKDSNELILFKAFRNGESISYITQDDVT